MPHIERVVYAGKVMEIEKYHCSRYDCKGEKRRKKENTSIDAQQKVNIRQSTQNLRWKLNCNFVDGDLWVEFDYRKELRPANSMEMQEHMTEFLKQLRKEYAKQGVKLKYVYCKELGPRGGSHIHMVMNYCEGITRILRRCWTKGGIHIDPLYSNGDYSQIAEYMHKYADKTVETEGKQIGKRYYSSKGMKMPKITRRIVRSVNTFQETPRERKGYYLIKESVISGITQAGYGYFSYWLHKTKDYEDETEGEDG